MSASTITARAAAARVRRRLVCPVVRGADPRIVSMARPPLSPGTHRLRRATAGTLPSVAGLRPSEADPDPNVQLRCSRG